ncbi:unnamed protein product [Dovyalis caffra]|uniref:Uncharacterized protein n=1 Tax=Dovyalis caffra TaxID=77055 RepID=A0AAV1R1I9_9ROSI|nr:unnamed protein product [Dovyalis caffra]
MRLRIFLPLVGEEGYIERRVLNTKDDQASKEDFCLTKALPKIAHHNNRLSIVIPKLLQSPPQTTSQRLTSKKD